MGQEECAKSSAFGLEQSQSHWIQTHVQISPEEETEVVVFCSFSLS
ncbi:hypothetical protein KP509_20G038100 [Ceratopteris richardii]|uniref:Uncharacterized protein n=1 Tax=Ceratopteris richardii TaxID=49495 RepID=A0A8T2SHM0_CERRI|nr:hypothetical protein KP509_20G038100 [Ceratopteris richardii]